MKRFGQVSLLQKENFIRLGIDLGGTKIEVLVINNEGDEKFRDRVITPKNDYKATISAITRLIAKAENEVEQPCSIGVCTPGSLSPKTQLLRNSNSVCLNGKHIQSDLEKLLGRKIRITNDANCFALSEAVDGSAKDAEVVFGVIIGTGTGAGIVINKRVILGQNAIAGEWGHNPLPWPDSNELNSTQCWCGKNGCIETFLSGPALEQNYQKSSSIKLSAEEIIKLASQGNEIAELCIETYEIRLAKSLAHIINVLDPNYIVLGGGMSNIQRLYDHIPILWGKWIFSDVVTTKLVSPMYGDSSGVRGAAWLWDE